MELQAKEKEGLIKPFDPLMGLALTELRPSRSIHFSHQRVVPVSGSFHFA
jgi:hypothetical protein